MGWTRQLGDGRWQAFESAGSGPRRVQAAAIRRLKREAQDAARDLLAAKVRASAELEPHTLTLSAYLTHWTTHLATQGRSAKSLARYEAICEALPAKLAKRMLADLRPLHLQRHLDAREAAPATVRKEYAVLHAALAQAVAWRLIGENSMEAVTPPRLQRREMTALSEKATAALLAGLRGTRYWAPAMLAVTAGLRRGELLALRWSDVDLKGCSLRVTRAADEVPGKPVAFKATKTGKGRRVALMAATVACLRQHKREQAAARLEAKRWEDHGLVFPGRHGEPWRPSTFSVHWGRLAPVRTAGVRFHDLRHTHATLLLRAGVPVNEAAKRLGHSPTVMMHIYAHVLDDADAAAVERLESGLGAALAGDSAELSADSPM